MKINMLFPAYAGVIPRWCAIPWQTIPFPRIRGGDPAQLDVDEKSHDFSPHTRG